MKILCLQFCHMKLINKMIVSMYVDKICFRALSLTDEPVFPLHFQPVATCLWRA